jgi:hypothetical protein
MRVVEPSETVAGYPLRLCPNGTGGGLARLINCKPADGR